MYESHVPPYVGHCGIQATTQAIETYFYWPSMRKDIHIYMWINVWYVRKLNMKEERFQAYCNLYLFQIFHGRVFQWTLSLDYPSPYKEILEFGL